MAVSFVDCHDELLPSLQTFLARVYRPDYILRINEQLFRWQFGETPVSKTSLYHIKVALLEGEIAGLLGYVPVEVSLGERVVRGAWTANWAVDPNWQRLGLGVLLMRELTRQFDITLVVGLSRDSRLLLPRMGWSDFGELTRYVYIVDPQRARTLTETGGLEWPEATRSDDSALPPDVAINLVDRFSDESTRLWDTTLGASAAGTRRTAKFLNWRYAGHPVFDYRLFEVRRNGQLRGLAVYRVEQVRNLPVRVGRIVELVAESGLERCLLDTVIDDARSQDVVALDFFCASQRFSTLMAQCGFIAGEDNAAAQIPTLFQPIDRRRTGIPFMAYLRNVPDAAELHDWYVTKGDGDQDRPN
jgi:GNAT superfamily N-acetyltransferase